MKNTLIIALLFAVTTLFSCNETATTKTDKPANATESSDKKSDELYFDFAVDGKEMSIAADDISSTYSENPKGNVFKIFAGKDGEVSVLLTIPGDMSKPSRTPSGSTNYDLEITQGSVSLQNFPEKNYTTNSFNTTYPEMSQPIADAVVVTSSELVGDKGRIITGTFSAKTFGSHSGTDPKDTDHTVTGKFRIMHEFRGIKF